MASITPRQRQYHVAVTAQQHNLNGDLQLTLHNLAANVPPEGDQLYPDRYRDVDRAAVLRAAIAQQHNLSANLQGTLFVPSVDPPPPGQALLQMPVRRTERPQPDPPLNLAPTLHNLAANVPPEGARLLDLPRVNPRRQLFETRGPSPSLLETPPEAPPPGDQLQWTRFAGPALRVIHERPDTNRLLTLLNEAANVPPQGDHLLWQPPRPRHDAQQRGLVRGFSAATFPEAPPDAVMCLTAASGFAYELVGAVTAAYTLTAETTTLLDLYPDIECH